MTGWNKLLSYVLTFIAGGVIFWLLRSAIVPEPKDVVTRSSNVNVTNQEIELVAKDSGKTKPQIFTRPRKPDTSSVTVLEPVRETEIYTDTLRKSGVIDTLKYKGEGYPIKYSLEVPHKIIINPDRTSTWFSEAVLKLGLPIISETTSIDSTKIVSKPVFLPTPFFMQTWFWIALIELPLLIIAIIF